jgi:RNA polymerase sigma factor (TIGR02999 family)
MNDSPGDITNILQRVRDGEPDAENELLRHLYKDLKRIAAAQIRGGRDRDRISPTELVHEAYVVLRSHSGLIYDWQNRQQFIAVAAQAMRRLLIDLARKGVARKRDHQPVTLDRAEVLAQRGPSAEQLTILVDLVERIREQNERQGRVIDCYFYCGFTREETADVLGISRRTVDRDLTFLKAWMLTQLNSGRQEKTSKKT